MKIKRNILLMYAIACLQGMVFYSAIATLYRQAVGVTIFQITIIESLSLFLALILELPWGIVAEKIGYKNTMILCSVLYFSSKIVFWQADSFAMFLMERILLSVVIAGLSGVDISILYLSCDEVYAHKAFSLYRSLQTVGMLIAAGIYTVFLHGQYRMAGFFTVISYGMAMGCAFFLKEVKSVADREKSVIREFLQILKDTFHRKEMFLFLIGVGLFSECHQTITVFLNQLQYVRSGMTDQMIGMAYVGMTIAGLIGVRSAHFAKKLGKRRAGTVLISMGTICIMFLTVTSNPWISILSIMLLRVVYSLLMPLVELIQNEQVRYSNRATALSINSVIMDGVSIATNLMFGRACDVNLTIALGMGGFFCLIAIVFYLYGTKKMGIK